MGTVRRLVGMSRSRRSWRAYAIAVIATTLATAVRWLLDPLLGEHIPFAPYYAAICVSGLLGGAQAAIPTLVAGLILGNLLFIPPRGTVAIHSTEQITGLFTYVLVGCIITWLSHYQRVAQLRVQASVLAARQELEERRRVEHALGERVKELKTLHNFAHLLLNPVPGTSAP